MSTAGSLALDTNTLVYAGGVNGAAKQADALALLDRLADQETLLPAQALGKLAVVPIIRAGPSRSKRRIWRLHDTAHSTWRPNP